jgi:hypothetical protein
MEEDLPPQDGQGPERLGMLPSVAARMIAYPIVL